MKISMKAVKSIACAIHALGYLTLVFTLVALLYNQYSLFESNVFINTLLIGSLLLIIYSPLRFSRKAKLVSGEHTFSCKKEKCSFCYNLVSYFALFLLACAGFSYLTITGEFPSMIYFVVMLIVLTFFNIEKVASILSGKTAPD